MCPYRYFVQYFGLAIYVQMMQTLVTTADQQAKKRQALGKAERSVFNVDLRSMRVIRRRYANGTQRRANKLPS